MAGRKPDYRKLNGLVEKAERYCDLYGIGHSVSRIGDVSWRYGGKNSITVFKYPDIHGCRAELHIYGHCRRRVRMVDDQMAMILLEHLDRLIAEKEKEMSEELAN